MNTESIYWIVLGACAITALITISNKDDVNPESLKAVSESCTAQGLVAFVEVTKSRTVIECRDPKKPKE